MKVLRESALSQAHELMHNIELKQQALNEEEDTDRTYRILLVRKNKINK